MLCATLGSIALMNGAAADSERWIVKNLGPVSSSQSLGGGSGWASLRRCTVEDSELFVKASSRPSDSMFLGEAAGLRALHATQTLAVPRVVHFGEAETGSGSFLVMEYLKLQGKPEPRVFGRRMAEMHLAPCAQPQAAAGMFGFSVDNTIGATPQQNAWCKDWVEFFRERRIGFQIKTAADAALRKEWDQVLDATDGLRDLFTDLAPGEIKPSVLHGDLWSGNIAAVDGEPAIFDPAVYYGHHEAEWGMSWCASFPPAFWEGYRELIPEAEGFARRRPLYELYHILNHYNLFGGGYYGQSRGLLAQLARCH